MGNLIMNHLPPDDDNPPYVQVMCRVGLAPDPWQVEVLQSKHPQLLLNCCRQACKSTVVGIFALVEALFKPMTRVVLVSLSHRQSRELLKTIRLFFDLLRKPCEQSATLQEIELTNMSRIISL